jgi:23S rRNA (guanine745-N1)-methyltransferase
MKVALKCPVRGCGEALVREGARWACSRGHSFDKHRSGYLNLLQPQDRRSAKPGDSKEAALARRRLASLGHADSLYRAFAHAVRSRPDALVSLLDVGCGEGALLRFLAPARGLELHGLDISAPSIELAAKAHPEALFTVANADRGLPYADRSFDFITSIDSRLHVQEFARLLAHDGLVLVAVPAPDDLAELREQIQGAAMEKSRATRVEEEMAPLFSVAERTVVREIRTFDRGGLRDLLTATYRGFRKNERAAAESLSTMAVTLSHELLAFRRR